MAKKKVSRKNTKKKVAAPAKRFSVYVIELDQAVLKSKRFRDKNPDHDPEKPCFYVGMTARTPQERFEQHMRGHKSGRYVRKHGKYLRRRLFNRYNPMTYEDAVAKEPWLARLLRERGHGVWQN